MSNRSNNDKHGFIRAISPVRDLKNLFLWLVGSSAVIYFITYLILGNGRFKELFFSGGGDFFMDCFNSIRDAAQGKEVYSVRHVIYPPMANLLFLILSRFTPDAYNDTPFSDRYSWIRHYACIILLYIIISVCFVMLFALVLKATKRGSLNKRMVFSALIVLSVPILYMMERGNMLILCVISLLVYAFAYNSESKLMRELGLLALAFSFSLKLYPVVFGWFLIADKRYKDALRCAAYGFAMILIPSFFFGGPIFVIKHLFLNITSFSSGSGNSISEAMDYLKFSDSLQSAVNIVIYAWVFICAICFAISPFIRPDKPYKTWIIGMATILCVPSLTRIYNWAFLLIPIIMLANKDTVKIKNIIYFIFMTIPFIFIPFKPSLPLTMPNIMVYVMTAVLSIFTVADTFVDLGKFIAERKARKLKA